MRHVFLNLIAIGLVVAVLSGCGDNDSKSESDAKKPVIGSENGEHTAAKSKVGDSAKTENTAAKKQDSSKRAEKPRKFALLVGCTKYDFLPATASLKGPGNDCKLMTGLLVDHFGFLRKHVTILADHVGKKSHRPLRANIKREFKNLAGRVRSGDRVVVLLSGHGSQMPDDDPMNPDDPEPDGLDEIFCPADLKPGYDFKKKSIPNAIRDDDLRRWLDAIRAKGASVWVIIDACHSGSAVRGTEVYRQLDPATLVSEAVLQQAASQATRARGQTSETNSFDMMERAGTRSKSKKGGLVAIYAAQPHEPTFELPLPKGKFGAPVRGLLTYTMVKVLTQSPSSLTYTELVQRIHMEYVSTMGRLGPTPLIEGNDRHKEVLGKKEWSGRSRFVLDTKSGGLSLNAGELHGMGKGSILAVFPPPGARAVSKPLGHVRIKKVGLTKSVVEPCEFNRVPANRQLPNGGRCELVQVDHSDFRLKVAIQAGRSGTDALRNDLERLSTAKGSLLKLVTSAREADWLIKRVNKNQLVLVPAEGWSRNPRLRVAHAFGPIPNNERAVLWLKDRLGRIARARSLLRIAGASGARQRRGASSRQRSANATKIHIELLRLKEKGDPKGQPVRWKKGGIEFREGDFISLKIHNRSRHSIDFSLLFIDSGFGIDPIFPPPDTVVDNRLKPGRSITIGPLQIEGDSFGMEHVVLIALKAEGQTLDFSWLAQDSIEQARKKARTRSADDRSFKGPLGRLFQQAMFAQNTTRGLKIVETDGAYLNVLSWRVRKLDTDQ